MRQTLNVLKKKSLLLIHVLTFNRFQHDNIMKITLNLNNELLGSVFIYTVVPTQKLTTYYYVNAISGHDARALRLL